MNTKETGNKYMSIGDFSEIVRITAASLRHYDRIGAFPPAVTGDESDNGYRYYRPTQITAVKMIGVLTEIGVPLETIKALAQKRTPEDVVKLLNQNTNKVSEKIRFLQEVLLVIDTFISLLNEGIGATEDEISLRERPERTLMLGTENRCIGSPGDFYDEFVRFLNAPHEPDLNLCYPVGGYWPDMAAFHKRPFLPTQFYSLTPHGNERQSAGLYLTGYTRGYYGQVGDLPQRMEAFAKENGLRFAGPVYAIHLFDEVSITDPEQYLLQISAAVVETRRTPVRY